MREQPKETGEACDKCGQPMVVKRSRWGKEFLACSGYPACKNARDIGKPASEEPKTEESEATADETA